jgi:hypothetical protein
MKLATIAFLLMPVVMFAWLLSATRSSHTFQPVLFWLCLLSVFICLVWGLFISSRSRIFGWLCIGAALIYLAVVVWPLFERAKIHTDIIEYETHVA